MMDKGFQERVRLLLLDTPRHKIPEDSDVWPKKWPSYVGSAVWWGFFFTAVASILLLLALLALSRYDEHDKAPLYLNRLLNKLALTDKGEGDLSTLLQSSHNAFYETREPLSWSSSCGLESLVKHSANKNVFHMVFNQRPVDGPYEKRLRSEYSNLMTLKADGEQFFKGSMFDGEWRNNDKSLRAAEYLTVWQFGGTLLGENVVVTGELPSNEGQACLVSPDLISCPNSCSAFLYQLVLTARDSNKASSQEVVDRSFREFCGNPAACSGARRLPNTCNEVEEGCLLVRLNERETPSNETWNQLAPHCPITYATWTSSQ